MTPVDFLGKPITVGCHCAYPVRRGSRMWLTTMCVEGIEQVGDIVRLRGYNATGYSVSILNIRNCIVVEAK